MSQFVFEERGDSSPGRRSRRSFPGGVVLGVVCLAAAAGGGWWFVSNRPATLVLAPIADQTIREGEKLSLPLQVQAAGLPQGQWSFGIVSAPTGVRVDRSGVVHWTPAEDQGPREYDVTVAVQAKGSRPVQAKATFKVLVEEVNQPPVPAPFEAPHVKAGEALTLTLKATDADEPAQSLRYDLKSGPPGATLDAKSGLFQWLPPADTQGTFDVDVRISDLANASESADESGPQGTEVALRFTIHVEPGATPAMRLVTALQEQKLELTPAEGSVPGEFRGRPQHYELESGMLTVLEYDTPAAVAADAAQVEDAGKMLFGKPAQWKERTRLYRRDMLLVLYTGRSDEALRVLQTALGEPFVVADASRMEPMPDRPAELSVPEKLLRALVSLHEKQNLTGRKDYPGVRKVFADFIEQQNRDLLDRLSDGDGAEFRKWFDEHTEFKEEFLTALSPSDDLAAAWNILQRIHQKSPTRLGEFSALAIATALTWDSEQNVDHYTDHQQRTHSRMPASLLGALENFDYFVDTAGVMQGRSQFLPWEFLVYLVNHQTPRAERDWAVTNYVPRRAMYGKCYSDVPYDHEMLRTESRVCKLEGKDYTLPNIRQFGGVCAMQADFAARVGKSIGVPAEYVSGEAAGGELHAWVMWVELKQVSRSGISFVLESHGRYRGDKYYVGKLRDPQTGQAITDRQLELRLHAVGQNPVAFRQARLIMQAYPQLRDHFQWTAVQEIAFLNEVIELCPGNESAWQSLAALARDGRIEADSNRQMTAMVDRLFRTFSAFPDFTWTVFDDLVQYQKMSRQRNKFYERLVQMFEAAGRPDLACEARLRLSDYLLEEGMTKEVIEGLAFTIKKFPDEGRYVPRLLDKLEQVCQNVRGADQQLLKFYAEFIPLVPQKRGDAPSPYCMRMLERAIEKFTAAGQAQQAQLYATQLAQLRASEQ